MRRTLRRLWRNHLLYTASRLERKIDKLNYRIEDCRTFAARHTRKLGE